MTSTPACPRCGQTPLTALRVEYTRNRWGGSGPTPRPEEWWECSGCGWVGYRDTGTGPLTPMRRPEGGEADCFFCGEEGGNVVSEPWRREDGELRDWVVCLSCGTSNQRRVRGLPGGG
ncbi:hypothetical protein [Streptomyces katrae]|uniref:Uncharacterized protein n=1 Tax=Streptomyces katrae TaxID=68223 RepID=A0A0F4IC99_9ACTN|nr:hypothetical protein [Streptomyces katrae]KJY19632.1 hypothetical protein VR44_39045 [Streptomyces katrae]